MKHICFLLILCGATGCLIYDGPIYDSSKVGYIQDGFDDISLQNGGLALLPVVAAQGQETYRRPFADAINQAVLTIKPGMKYVASRETMLILNEADLVRDYQQAISSYRETAIIDRTLLANLAESVAVRYFLFISLDTFHETSKWAKVSAFAQVWDCSTGAVVWEGRGSAESPKTSGTYDEQKYDKYCHIAATGLIRRLFNVFTEDTKNSPSAIDRATPDYWR